MCETGADAAHVLGFARLHLRRLVAVHRQLGFVGGGFSCVLCCVLCVALQGAVAFTLCWLRAVPGQALFGRQLHACVHVYAMLWLCFSTVLHAQSVAAAVFVLSGAELCGV